MRSSILTCVVMLLAIAACSDDVQSPVVQIANKVAPGKPGWHWSNPQPQGNQLLDVAFFDENVGFAVGMQGAIVGSTDGGQTWTLRESGVSDVLFGVATTGAMTATAVGLNGTILQTTNRGATWKRRNSGVQANLQDVDFGDALHGIVVGANAVLRTSDGGTTWASCGCGLSLVDIDMVDAHTAFAVGNWKIYKTEDGGESWDSLAVNRGSLNCVSFSDANTGTVVGELGTILRTADGGVTWSLQQSHTRADLQAVKFADSNHGFAAGRGDYSLLHTNDGGEHWISETWRSVVPRVHPEYSGVAMVDATTAIVLGSAGNIIRTTDGGTNWANTIHIAALQLNEVSFANEKDGIAVGFADILRTTDGGGSWERRFEAEMFLWGVAHCGPGTVVAVGLDTNPRGGVILHSTDGGDSWTTTHPGTSSLYGVDFADGCVGATVGEDGAVLRTVDGGASWALQAQQTVEALWDVSMLDANVGIAVGTNDTILRTIDGGILWNYRPHELIHGDFTAVDFADADLGIAVGARKILRTADGGLTWVELQTGMDIRPYDVVCPARDIAVVLGTLPGTGWHVLVTTDAGEHWAVHDVITTDLLRGVTVSGNRTVTVVGGGGAIIQARDLFRPGV